MNIVVLLVDVILSITAGKLDGTGLTEQQESWWPKAVSRTVIAEQTKQASLMGAYLRSQKE